MENLIKKFREIGNLSKDNEKILLGAIERVECGAKTVLHKKGKICDTIYFVEKGIARTFYYKNGNDITYWITMENDFVGGWQAFSCESLLIKWWKHLNLAFYGNFNTTN